ncbi:LysR family transcriptional regulator [Inquilinus sp. Marseille-Q2685]|uniref:LysR family transcriptional regulator n=1 Tax=Inquilinus sp. Marseille-Q2685 TaxID=2866581 RepID=UPI001CE44562|nr:LysR substrate-binding domain-containing protein [Inquilinus sp. Marseille-Q2685]
MELRQLAHFLAVVEERHFTRAARRVHLTQSSLSASIRALERELDSELFVRSTRNVEVTEAGRALLPHARQALAAAEAGRDAVAGVHGLLRGQLAIGMIQTFGLIPLPALLTRYHRLHPGVTLRLRHGSAGSLVTAVAQGELELAFVDHPLGHHSDRVTVLSLGREALVLAVAAGDSLAARRQQRLAGLADRDFVEYRPDSALRATIDAACREAGLERRIRCEADTVGDLVELVAQGFGVALLPPLALSPAGERVVGIATDPPIRREIAVVSAADRPPTPAAAALLDLLP